MGTRTIRRLAVAAGLAWLMVAGYGLWQVIVADDSDWQVSYALFTVALLAGAALALAGAALATVETGRPRLRVAGLAVGGLGCVLAAIVAWAMPVWMAVLGAGFVMIACASGAGARRGPALAAAGQLAGIAVLIAAIEAKVGQPDSYGDYPAAGGLALLFVAGVMIVALAGLSRRVERQDDSALVLAVTPAE